MLNEQNPLPKGFGDWENIKRTSSALSIFYEKYLNEMVVGEVNG